MTSKEEFSGVKNLPRKGRSKVKVLIVFANPLNTEALRLGTEDRVIREAVTLSPYRANISLTIRHAATIHDLRRLLLRERFQIIHISGHGDEEGLVFEDELGRENIVPPRALAQLFQAYSPPIECVILNACYSIAQGRLTSLGVPYTIAMEGSINDDAAIEFARGFYDAIGAGKSFGFAYEEGCRSVSLAKPNIEFDSNFLIKDEANSANLSKKYRVEYSLITPVDEIITNSEYCLQSIRDGDSLYQIGDYQQAVLKYDEALNYNPQTATAFNSKGAALEILGKHEEAIAAYKEAIRLEPNFVYPYTNLGKALGNVGRYEEAIAAYKEAIRLEPDDYVTHFFIGNSYSRTGQYEEAVTAYKEAIRLEPDQVESYANLGCVLCELELYEAALEIFEKIAQISPKDAINWSNLADSLYYLERYGESLEACEKAIALNPKFSFAYANKGRATQEIGQYTEAIEAYQKAINLNSTCYEAHIGLGNLLKQIARNSTRTIHWS